MLRTDRRSITNSTQRGFGLIEVLVGCVLMAVFSLGACAAVHQALQDVRAAALQGHAAALLMDLAEELALAPDAATQLRIVDAWQHRVQRALPDASGALLPGEPGEIRLYWISAAAPQQLSLPLPPRLAGRA